MTVLAYKAEGLDNSVCRHWTERKSLGKIKIFDSIDRKCYVWSYNEM